MSISSSRFSGRKCVVVQSYEKCGAEVCLEANPIAARPLSTAAAPRTPPTQEVSDQVLTQPAATSGQTVVITLSNSKSIVLL